MDDRDNALDLLLPVPRAARPCTTMWIPRTRCRTGLTYAKRTEGGHISVQSRRSTKNTAGAKLKRNHRLVQGKVGFLRLNDPSQLSLISSMQLKDPKTDWGICSHHCYEDTESTTKLMETRLDIMSDKVSSELYFLTKWTMDARFRFSKLCSKLGSASGVAVETELCAALKHTDIMDTVVYKAGKKFTLETEKEEKLEYYGGSDACQGDSGGPL